MKIYIIDNNKNKLKYAKLYFASAPDVQCVCADFQAFVRSIPVECIVSPANSFGLMDGGYDLAITEYFGNQLQKRVQQYIIDHYGGEQPVGTSFLIGAGKDNRTLIHTPSMRVPALIKDPVVIYQCMRSTLLCAQKHGVQSIVIPLFGAGYGGIHPAEIAELMWKAYLQVQNPPKKLSWKYVNEHPV